MQTRREGLYLKWLLTRQGERVSEKDAIEAFIIPGADQAESVCRSKGWRYHQQLKMTLKEWVELLLAQEAVRAYFAEKDKQGQAV